MTMARLASTAGVRIETIGVGTAAGTTVQIDGFSVATALDAQTLENVARVTNGSYHQVGDGLARERRLPDDTTAFRVRERTHRDHGPVRRGRRPPARHQRRCLAALVRTGGVR